MNLKILSEEVQSYLRSNLKTSIKDFALRKSPFDGVSSIELSTQLKALQIIEAKIPSWLCNNQLLFPKKLHLEQSSSEETAVYKSELVSGKTMVDLCCGLGVDLYFMGQKFKTVSGCDTNCELLEFSEHNLKELGLTNFELYCIDGIEFLKTTDRKFDWIFIDPSRRTSSGKRVFLLRDASPDVTSNLDLLLRKGNNIMIKASPLADLRRCISDLQHIKQIHVISVNNELKEVLLMLEKKEQADPLIYCLELRDKKEIPFSFRFSQENELPFNISGPKDYIYEPNSSILKAGAFKSIASKYDLEKLHKNSHLYTSDRKIDFPGRRFQLLQNMDFNKKNLKDFKGTKANISCRNFPMKPEELKRKFKLSDGGDLYWFFTTDHHESLKLLICEKA